MTFANVLQDAAFLMVLTLLVKPVGTYVARVFACERTVFDAVLRPLEGVVHRLIGLRPLPMTWRGYAGAFALFSAINTFVLFLLLRWQQFIPGGPSQTT